MCGMICPLIIFGWPHIFLCVSPNVVSSSPFFFFFLRLLKSEVRRVSTVEMSGSSTYSKESLMPEFALLHTEPTKVFTMWKERGNDAFRAQKYITAVDWYNLIIANYEFRDDFSKDDLAAVYSNTSAAFAGMFRYDEALGFADRAVAARPGWVKAHYRRALALQNLSRLQEAKASFERAVELDQTGSSELVDAVRTVNRLLNEGNAMSLVCPICMDDPMLEPILLVPCHHALCAKCTSAQMDRGMHLCPVCRKEMTGQSFVPLAVLQPPLLQILSGTPSSQVPSAKERKRYSAAWFDLGLALIPTRPQNLPSVTVNGQTLCGLKCLEKSAALDPKHSDVWVKIGIFARLSEREAVVEGKKYTEKAAIIQAVRVDKTNLLAWFKLGFALYNEGEGAVTENVDGRQVSALDCLEKVFQNPPFMLMHNGLGPAAARMIRMMPKGRKLIFMRKSRTAIEIGQYVLEELEPESDELWEAMAAVLQRENATFISQGQVINAKRALEKAESLKSVQQNFGVY